MFLWDLLIALTVAFFISAPLIIATGRRGRRKGIFWLFLIIFTATWAGGIWIRPFGPTFMGVPWSGFLVAGLVFVLILASFFPQKPPEGRQETLEMLEQIEQEDNFEQVVYITLNLFFWLLLCVLIIAIISRYLMSS